MKLSKRSSALVATAIAAAMLMTACGGSDDSGGGERGRATGGTLQHLHRRAREPARPGQHHGERGQPGHRRALDRPRAATTTTARSQYNGVADSIESDDATTWTVKLKDGWTFHDGTPVDRQLVRRRLELHRAQHQRPGRARTSSPTIEGYDALQATTDDAGNVTSPPSAKEMTGLKVVDDTDLHRHADRAVRAVPA